MLTRTDSDSGSAGVEGDGFTGTAAAARRPGAHGMIRVVLAGPLAGPAATATWLGFRLSPTGKYSEVYGDDSDAIVRSIYNSDSDRDSLSRRLQAR